MAGLIWKALGKGIADSSSMYGSMVMKENAEAASDERALKKAEALERLKASMAEEAAQKDADVFMRAQTRAAEIGATRTAQQLETESGALAGNAQDIKGASPAATQEEMKRHLERLSPSERDAVAQTGLIGESMSKTRKEMQGYDDTVTAAREIGASSTVMKSLQEVKKARLEEIRVENAEKKADAQSALENRREDRRAEEFKALLPVKQQVADAATTRANRPASSGAGGGGGGGGAKVRSTKTDSQGNVIAIMSDGTTKPLGIRSSDFDKNIANTIAAMQKDDYKFGKLPESEKRAQAIERLTGSPARSPTRDNGNVNPGTRPPLSAFKQPG